MDTLTDMELAFTKFGVGQSVPRSEDPKLLRGEGRYTDDINLPNQAWAVSEITQISALVLRSRPGLDHSIPNTASRA